MLLEVLFTSSRYPWPTCRGDRANVFPPQSVPPSDVTPRAAKLGEGAPPRPRAIARAITPGLAVLPGGSFERLPNVPGKPVIACPGRGQNSTLARASKPRGVVVALRERLSRLVPLPLRVSSVFP